MVGTAELFSIISTKIGHIEARIVDKYTDIAHGHQTW